MARFKLRNGISIEGASLEDAKKIAATLNTAVDGNFYYSESKGELLLISEMDTKHLKNAIVKVTRKAQEAFMRNLSQLEGIDFLRAMRDGVEDTTLNNLIREYAKRHRY